MFCSLEKRLLLVILVLVSLTIFSASAFAGVDDYPSPWRAPTTQDSMTDNWGQLNRECASFSAWRLHSRNGFEIPWAFGYATDWGSHATNLGYAVNGTPAVGSIAWWSSGHVAWVESINGSQVTVEEYNYDPPYQGLYGERTISASSPTGYIHFKDMTTFVRYSSPAIAVLSSGYETAFEANNLYLYTYVPGGSTNLNQGMKSGTSPSIAASSYGGYQIAFQANNGYLYTYDSSGGPANTSQGMMDSTSPAIAALSTGGYVVAFQANNGYLYYYTAGGGPVCTYQGMKSGTSPAIATNSSGGFRIAFQANNGYLYTYDSSGGPSNLGQGMMSGTSPSITCGSIYRIAFQANNGYLYTYDSGPTNTGQGMLGGTSPAITTLSSGNYQIAFQANSGYLYTYNSGGSTNTYQGMKAGTSPSIAPNASNGFEVAFHASTDNLYTYDSSGGVTNTAQGM